MSTSLTDKLVEENLGLVNMVVKRYIGQGTEYDDLFQIGALGLVKAAQKFDPSMNLKFSTYAVSKIAGELKTYFRDNGAIKISRSKKEQLFKIKKAIKTLTAQLNRSPTVSEIACETALTVEEVVDCLEIKETVLSLDKESEEGGSLYDVCGEGSQESELLRLTVWEALDKLTAKERQIIVLRYFLDQTQSRVAEATHMSQVSVSRMEKNILKKLSKMIS